MKTAKVMSKALAASVLMLPLALPVAAQAQPPVTWSGSPGFHLQYVQATPAVLYQNCLQTDTEYSFNVTANVNLEGTYTVDFTARNADGYAVSFDLDNVQGSGPQSYGVNVTFRTPSTPTNEQAPFFIDLAGISRGPSQGGPADETSLYVGVPCLTAAQPQPTATPAPSATPTPSASAVPTEDNTISFKLNVNGEPCDDAMYWGLVAIFASDGFVYTQLTDEDDDGIYTGTAPTFYDEAKLIVQLVQGTGVGQSTPMPGGTPVPVPGEPDRVIANFGTQQQDGSTYLVVNDDFLAEALVNGCAAAPSATPTPSATAKPSATASATPAPSTAPTKLPDTGAADTMLGGLLAAGAALAASGGYLLRRRSR